VTSIRHLSVVAPLSRNETKQKTDNILELVRDVRLALFGRAIKPDALQTRLHPDATSPPPSPPLRWARLIALFQFAVPFHDYLAGRRVSSSGSAKLGELDSRSSPPPLPLPLITDHPRVHLRGGLRAASPRGKRARARARADRSFIAEIFATPPSRDVERRTFGVAEVPRSETRSSNQRSFRSTTVR